jgi:hypothetical protein
LPGSCLSHFAQQLAPLAQHAFVSEMAAVLNVPFVPQHALASAQHLAPCRQHSCTAAQQALLSAQHLRPLAQQASFAGAGQHVADSSLQQASFLAQQSCAAGFTSAAGAATKATPIASTRASSLVNMSYLQSKIIEINRHTIHDTIGRHPTTSAGWPNPQYV